MSAPTVQRSQPEVVTGVVPSLPVFGALMQRALRRFVRIPSLVVPTVVMPLFFITAFTGSFDGVSRIDGYPTDRLVNWVAAFAVLQSSAFAGIGAAAIMANDLENRFIDRLMVSPLRRSIVVLGPLGQAAVRALIPTSVVLLVAVAKGATLPGGVAGLAMVYLGGMGMAVVMGALGVGVVLMIGNIRAMAIVQVFGFVVLFPSTGQVPVQLMEGWLATVARYNPATALLATTRQGFLGPVTWSETWPGLLVLVVSSVLFGAFAVRQLQRLSR